LTDVWCPPARPLARAAPHCAMNRSLILGDANDDELEVLLHATPITPLILAPAPASAARREGVTVTTAATATTSTPIAKRHRPKSGRRAGARVAAEVPASSEPEPAPEPEPASERCGGGEGGGEAEVPGESGHQQWRVELSLLRTAGGRGVGGALLSCGAAEAHASLALGVEGLWAGECVVVGDYELTLTERIAPLCQ
jgi:hypothetical protein